VEGKGAQRCRDEASPVNRVVSCMRYWRFPSSIHASCGGQRGRAAWPGGFDVPCGAVGASCVAPLPESVRFLARHITRQVLLSHLANRVASAFGKLRRLTPTGSPATDDCWRTTGPYFVYSNLTAPLQQTTAWIAYFSKAANGNRPSAISYLLCAIGNPLAGPIADIRQPISCIPRRPRTCRTCSRRRCGSG
jgi:hypothetical protein